MRQVFLLVFAVMLAAAVGPARAARIDAVIAAEIAARGRARIIVSFAEPASADPAGRGQAIARQQDRLTALPGVAEIRRYATLPALAATVDAAGLAALAQDAAVGDIAADRRFSPVLARQATRIAGRDTAAAIPRSNWAQAFQWYLDIIGAPILWRGAIAGKGRFVVVIDSGVQTTHPAFAGKRIVEACFSADDPAAGTYSLCPGRAQTAIGPGTASICPDRDLLPTLEGSCDHGTFVASLAIGNDATSGLKGVAPDGDLVAIQVFSRVFDPATRTWRLFTDAVDVFAALDYAAQLAEARPGEVAAVNLSLGGGAYSGDCTGFLDPTYLRADALGRLNGLGVLTAAAAGNEGRRGQVAEPACLVQTMAVAATDRADRTSIGANTNLAVFPFIWIAAPGENILGAVYDGYALMSGTSMATPLVAGAVALLDGVPTPPNAREIRSQIAVGGDRLNLDGYLLPRLDIPRSFAGLFQSVARGR